MFKFGQAFGTVQGILAALKVPTHLVAPVTWKRHFRLPADKETVARSSIADLAGVGSIWPKKDHGRPKRACWRFSDRRSTRPAGTMTDALRADWQLIDSVRDRAYDIFVFAEKKRLHDLVCMFKSRGQSHRRPALARTNGRKLVRHGCTGCADRAAPASVAQTQSEGGQWLNPIAKPGIALSKIQQRWIAPPKDKPWVKIPIDVMDGERWHSLSVNDRRMLDALMCQHFRYFQRSNGDLEISFGGFLRAGITHRRYVAASKDN